MKQATLKASNVLNRDFTIKDTGANVKILAVSLNKVFGATNKLDAEVEKGKNHTWVDYSLVIADQVYSGLVELLHLDKEDAKKLEENMSYSEVFDFYKKMVNDFLQMEVPEVNTLNLDSTENEGEKQDPKEQED
ncbi:hypothetical protein [Lactobacillus jensenii]|jgi:hypothetical protein|uniref:Phage tail protein n=1 Tax=Lactobacillus jensenii TaxID=109790 RepID=A0ABU9FH69_LACJE|nr:hypothetical protein [Lactobacillus jensenii]DAR66691.1 MAG TPA: tail assembly chaperone protein [Caudoviricetes sp.]MCW8072261.1 hypothetical protein [Lactobacillus jensenii]MCW8089646.1 hypothetical protein [Lactobacillus jensenii]MDK8235015.1 hypothetical protein [Lactobacillus jensenii]MDT9545643.1 hypothetical protein [Lactobacillus jensenii]